MVRSYCLGCVGMHLLIDLAPRRSRAFEFKIVSATHVNSIKYSFSGGCPDGYVEFESSCYKVYTDSKYAYAASDACAEDGAHLAYITSQAEQDFVAGQSVASTWIGLRKLVKEDAYSWPDGTPLDFTMWQRGEPMGLDCINIMCVRLGRVSDYNWTDSWCRG